MADARRAGGPVGVQVDSVTDVPTPDEVLQELLGRYPDANVSAVTVDGTPIPVPRGVALGARHVLTGTSGLRAYEPADRPVLVDAFVEARRTGLGVRDARSLLGRGTLTVHFVDVLEQHGAVVVVGTPAAGDERGAAGAEADDASPPRLARLHKDRTGLVLGIDAATTEILGWTSEQVVGRRSLEFLHPDDQGLAIESWAVLLGEPGSTRRTRLRHLSSAGEWVWFDVLHSAGTWRGQECLVADMIDISAEMQAQSALQAREQLLAQLAHALPLGVFQMDPDRSLAFTNQRLFDVMGSAGATTFDELVQWVVPRDRRRLSSAATDVLADGAEREVDVRVGQPTGSDTRVCQVTLRRLTSTAASPGLVGCVQDVTERSTLRRELEDRATFDQLTGLYNRAAIMSLLAAALSAQQPGTATAVLFIDLDLFKSVNDQYGHLVGDEFLTATAGRLRGCLRDTAHVGRLGGDEFLVVLPQAAEAEAPLVAERVREALGRELALSVGSVRSRASVGMAVTTTPGTDVETLVRQADEAMYAQKRRHR